MMHVGVVVRGTEAAGARVLAEQLGWIHPDWPVTVVALPGATPDPRRGEQPFDVLTPPALLDRALEQLASTSPLDAVERLLRPLLVEYLLDHGAERVLLLGPDAEVHARLDTLESALDGADAVLVPRLAGTLPDDGERPDGGDLLAAGEVDDELVAVRATEDGRRLVRWWVDRCVEAAEAVQAVASGPPTATARLGGSPLATARRMFPGARLLEDAGYDVSYWNLHERRLAREGDTITAGGRPLSVMRFAGFRPDRPWWLSEHGTRVLVLDDPVLTDLCGNRAAALWQAGWVAKAPDGVVGEIAPGVVYDDRLRRLHAEAVDAGEDFGSIDSPAGADAFLEWLAEPAPHGGTAGVNRYAYDAWREREDLQGAYPDLDGADAEGFIGWLWVHGRPELGLQDPLLPPAPAFIEQHGREAPATLVTGYLRGHLGLGEAARGYTAALQAAHVPVGTLTVPTDKPAEGEGRRNARRTDEREFEALELPPDRRPEVNLLCVNADQVPELVRDLGDDFLRGRYTIGQWAWETDVIPHWWEEAFDIVDEVWVYSRYVAENIGRATDVDVPVVVMPLPVGRPDPAGAQVPFHLPNGFTFLFAFDFLSTLQRKNPLGLIEAFRRAFAEGEGPTLLLKTINAHLRLEARERLRHAAGGRRDIRIVDAALTPDELAALFVRADCYVSLHRAEGYGLTLAESMALAKPVIATAFSGNTDFMRPANSYLVDWEPTQVGPDGEHYPAEGTWAEPSVEHAAALMREVWSDQDAARERGRRAQADVEATLNVQAVGALARRRLLRIAQRQAPAVEAAFPAPIAEVEHRLAAFDLSGRVGAPPGVRGLVRRGAYRALRPYTVHERSFDEAVVAALRHVAVDVAGERAAHDRDRRRHGRLARELRALERDLRASAARAEDYQRRLARIERNAYRLEEVVPLIEGARAIPYMAGEPYGADRHPFAGSVLGFRREDGTPAGEEEIYRRFEEVFRGPRERVAELIEPYLDLLNGHGPVLDFGCGRGELIEALAARGVDARGVDADAGMAAEARAAGVDVTVADGIEHLRALDDGSLGAITAIHVIEHLPAAALVEFFRLARAKLRAGGLLVTETINPHAPNALKTFWVDLTHQHPIFPEVALALADGAGFRRGSIWHPRGTRDIEHDRFVQDAYALTAEA